MTRFIGTVHMGITRISTLMAMGNNIIGDPLPAPMVKNKIFAQKFVLQLLILHLSGIFYNAPFQLVYLFKSLMLIIGAGLFASDTPGTVHHQFFILLMVGQVPFDNIQGIPKSIHIRGYGILKMPDFAFIMVAHIHQYRIRIFQQRIKSFGVYVDPLVSNIKSSIV